ncbi:MAG: hypothetical protein HQ582_03095 [Planctomycetes bacterium]|nr:hypothetical protein [Planctomycetota bacterium]
MSVDRSPAQPVSDHSGADQNECDSNQVGCLNTRKQPPEGGDYTADGARPLHEFPIDDGLDLKPFQQEEQSNTQQP